MASHLFLLRRGCSVFHLFIMWGYRPIDELLMKIRSLTFPTSTVFIFFREIILTALSRADGISQSFAKWFKEPKGIIQSGIFVTTNTPETPPTVPSPPAATITSSMQPIILFKTDSVELL